MTKQEFTTQWDEVTKLKMFEVSVIDKRTNEQDYIIFDIEVRDNMFVAEHVALNQKEVDSAFISLCSIEIDFDFSIDSNLAELYDACITGIMNSEFYELGE